MYEEFYGLDREPFRLTPDTGFCFQHQSYKKAKAYMQYALHRGEGFVMITGNPGTGKTTLINDLTSSLPNEEVICANIVSTQLQADDLLRMVVLNFGLDAQTDHKSKLLHELEQYLRILHQQGTRPLLIIDEAQDVPQDALEELRLLTNLQDNNKPLLQVFLVGQEGLRKLVLLPQLEQLHQRIIAACHLQPLSQSTTEDYVKYRLQEAGWNDDPAFAPEIYPLIFKFSLGIPRWINLICSRMLLHGMVEELHELSVDDALSVFDGLIHEQLLPAELATELNALRTEPEIQKKRQANAARTNESRVEKRPVTIQSSNNEAQVKAAAPNGEKKQTATTSAPAPAESPAASKAEPPAAAEPESHEAPEEEPRDAAKHLYSQLSPLLFGKPKDRRMQIFLEFLNGKSINGTVLDIPNNIATIGTAGFMVWLGSANNPLSNEIREVLWSLFDLIDR
jgi:putative secretion ATPase (PEP-CTERM system associated)